MAILPVLDYTDKDFDALLLALQTEIQSRLPGWTDFTRTSFGNMLLETFAFSLDKLTYYMDRYANEGHLPFLRTRRSLISLGKLIAFTPRGATAARVTLQFDLAAVAADDVIIPARTPVKTADGIIFETQVDLTIPIGQTQGVVVGENSVFHTTAFTGDGQPDQEYFLDRTPYLDDSATITVDAVIYIEVASFLFSTASGPDSRHFVVNIDENDLASVRFGNGTQGAAPPNGSAIAATYKTGGGINGNVAAATLVILDGSFRDQSNNLVDLSVTNPLAAVGGADREGLEEAKARAPLTLRQLGDRTVTKDDYVAHAEDVPGVDRAQALGKSDDPGLLANEVEINIVPQGGGLPSQQLKDDVKEAVTVTKPNTIGITVKVEDPSFNTIAITADITLEENAVEATVDQAIRDALEDFFQPLNDDLTKNEGIDFGSVRPEVQFKDLYVLVGSTPGVDDVDKATFLPATNTAIGLREFPELGAIVLNFV